MAKKLYKPTNTYDYTKSIDIRVNTSYITGLENILMYFFTNIIKDPKSIPLTFHKFEKISESMETGKVDPENSLDVIESMLFTLWTLQSSMKEEAYDKGYIIESKEEFSEEDITASIKKLMDNDAIDKDKVDNLLSLLKEKKSS
jgi:hypothetical protein